MARHRHLESFLPPAQTVTAIDERSAATIHTHTHTKQATLKRASDAVSLFDWSANCFTIPFFTVRPLFEIETNRKALGNRLQKKKKTKIVTSH